MGGKPPEAGRRGESLAAGGRGQKGGKQPGGGAAGGKPPVGLAAIGKLRCSGRQSPVVSARAGHQGPGARVREARGRARGPETGQEMRASGPGASRSPRALPAPSPRGRIAAH